MKIAVIGVGQMGSAIIKGLLNQHEDDIIGMNPVNPRVSKFAQEAGFRLVNSSEEVVSKKPAVVIITTPAKVTLAVLEELAALPRPHSNYLCSRGDSLGGHCCNPAH